MPKLLLHVCCATCAAHVLDTLRADFDVTAYYYNPNIYPDPEYDIRMQEVREFCGRENIPFIEETPDRSRWFSLTEGLEHEPERGSRCTICYRMRLEKTAEFARAHKYDSFGTDLSISPHKDAKRLNQIGAELEKTFGVTYLHADFKKQDGFKKAMARSRKECFYRQTYCGCKYSMLARQKAAALRA